MKYHKTCKPANRVRMQSDKVLKHNRETYKLTDRAGMQ